MDNISLDSTNPFLYLGGIASVSMLINIYCCLRNCRKKKEKLLLDNKYNSQNNNYNNNHNNNHNNNQYNQQDDIELTEQFANIVLPKLPETPTNTPTNTPSQQFSDIETGDIEKSNPKTDVTTQTEDCELYEMMGERFSQELDYYKAMNMKKK